MRTCDIQGCERKHVAKGLCNMHYVNAHRKAKGRKPDPMWAVDCAACGKTVQRNKSQSRRYRSFCDLQCRDIYCLENGLGAWGKEPKPPTPPAPKKDLRSTLRRALEDGAPAEVIAAIRSHCDIRPNGCWEWQRRLTRDGYAAVQVGSKRRFVHRLALEARLGKPLGKQPAHHACANTFCVNPDHLQPVTAAANSAEMMARRYMESRIADLETALAALQPSHALLNEVGVVRVA